ncbi:PTS cellobiose transporter subunit IIC [Clostridium chromiireducens]|uniref:Permease IIC component n=1 Tax=Clostridium chromiireducens TaxID=225345 RepID=A0A1V4IZ95_9CLOT|nr:PTS cellobiose transporter subunit IIC [Clostridium chromiireducens]OPJ64727.1 lichenan permease IIC component [Clostridium chromiireducens]RII35970.1 PTS cellobiose transporter subunit IIC [Clostridium chromiireducens]
MNGFINFLEEKAMPVAGKIAAQRHIRALRDGLAITMPLIIIGSIFMILANFPVTGYADFVNGIFGAGFTTKLLYPVRVTFDIVAVLAVISISYQLAKDKEVDGLSAGALSLAAFLMLTPVQTINVVLENGDKLNLGKILPTANLSAGGLIVAILTAIIATEIFIFVVKKNWVLKMPESVPPAVAKSFTAITPGLIILVSFFFIRLGFESTSYQTVFAFVTKFVGAPLALVGLSFGGMVSTISLYSFFWTLGIHGTRVVFGVMDSILLPAMDQNRLALEAGHQAPNIVTLQFYDNFVNSLGGCGATLGLIICIILLAKSKQAKSIGKLALAPAIFNISEPIIFGIPIVMNPIMMIPFILAPLAVGSLTYIAMATGLVSYPAGIAVPWTVPSFFSGFLATNGDWRAIILQGVNIIVSALIYWPFLKAWDHKMVQQEQEDSNAI